MTEHKCSHVRLNIKYVKNEDPDTEGDAVELSICSSCHRIVKAVCEHGRREWNKEQTKLSCLFCGMDCT